MAKEAPMNPREKAHLASSIISDNGPDQPGPIERMEIEPADNGFRVNQHHKPKPGKKDNGPSYEPPKKLNFASLEDVGNHVASTKGKWG